MKRKEEIREIFIRYNNVLRTSQLSSEKIHYVDIQRLLNDGDIEKIRRGYYHWVDQSNHSEVIIINSLFPDAILCMDTALLYYGYSDRNPVEWHLAVERNIAKQRVKIDYPFIKVYRTEAYLMPIGETVGSIDDIEVRIYDRERTICDCLKNMNRMDKELFNKAIQNYVRDSKKNIPNLMMYAKELRVQKKVRDLIGVWL
ncbi:type IV toxin-antitoxin system AbiEi family antitoxin domain-containing protein [Anaerosporobacter sp.]|uniref:type IV toxin-antitoxin system AbiEi family antitoxin domain-containing protein n=1 Tax=Anaerosporobacter sp. TaxID=1872529 RepID=UPI00286F6929|nr:type IV toxin-antitoxin system AbiEi family antitoxin domain-containing protein [Anaerosporobacter sp.]